MVALTSLNLLDAILSVLSITTARRTISITSCTIKKNGDNILERC